MSILWAALLILVLLVGWGLNLFSLPGNWVNVAAIIVYALLAPGGQRLSIGWFAVVLVVVLAILGEVVEAVASAAGVTRVGGSRRGAMLAMAGSMVGGVVGAFVGLPIPLVGSLIAILVFAGLGALAGAVIGERWKGQDWTASLNVGHAAFWGRLLGTLGKILVASLIVTVALAALLLE